MKLTATQAAALAAIEATAPDCDGLRAVSGFSARTLQCLARAGHIELVGGGLHRARQYDGSRSGMRLQYYVGAPRLLRCADGSEPVPPPVALADAHCSLVQARHRFGSVASL